MMRVLFSSALILSFQFMGYSQNANPYISVGMTPPKVIINKQAILEVLVGNAGTSTIQPNSLKIMISAGRNAEIIGIRPTGTDNRWILSTLGKGPGNTIELVNGGKTPFKEFDLGNIFLIISAKAVSPKPELVTANIQYINNGDQGNLSSLDDLSITSLTVSGPAGSPVMKPVNTTIIPTPEKQDLSISASECEVTLTWKLTAIKNPQKIEIEYSTDNQSFKILGEALPKQSSSLDYEYKYDQGKGKGYYRLRITQSNGQVVFSKVKDILTNCIIKKGF